MLHEDCIRIQPGARGRGAGRCLAGWQNLCYWISGEAQLWFDVYLQKLWCDVYLQNLTTRTLYTYTARGGAGAGPGPGLGRVAECMLLDFWALQHFAGVSLRRKLMQRLSRVNPRSLKAWLGISATPLGEAITGGSTSNTLPRAALGTV